MAIGLTARQRNELTAMLPNIEESVASLKRLIADAKDRTRALSRLADAEEAQKRHASEVGIPFNAEAFAKRRAELNALPKALTIEEGQLSSFAALQRAIGVILDGPYVREGRGGGVAKKKPARKVAARRGPARKAPKKSVKKAAAKKVAGTTKLEPRHLPSRKRDLAVNPLPLALGS